MTFSIKMLNETAPTIEYELLTLTGLITIGDFKETIFIPIHFWSAQDYKRQWREAARIIVSGVAPTSAFVTEMYEPKYATYIMLWSMYLVQETVYIHNQMLFAKTLTSSFDPMKPYLFVKEREVINEDGRQISEWSTSIKDIEAFLLELT